MKKYIRGFTLIELLVVIAIIGILASIILASLSTARGKANDAKVQEQLSGLRSAAEIYYGAQNPNSYAPTAVAALTDCTTAYGLTTNVFGDTASGSGAKNIVMNTSGSIPSGGVAKCVANSTYWAMYATLPSTSGSTLPAWCVDSNGVSMKITAAPTFADVNNLCK